MRNLCHHGHQLTTDNVFTYRASNGKEYQGCRECRRHNGRRAYNRDLTKNREIGRRKQIRRNYGITLEEREAKKASQHHRCAICRRPFADRPHLPTSPVVDHDHNTGAVRDILCTNCNVALGLMDEDVLRFEAAQAYLLKHSRRGA